MNSCKQIIFACLIYYIRQIKMAILEGKLQCNHDYFHDYFNEYPVSNIKTTFMESLGVILVLLLCH